MNLNKVECENCYQETLKSKLIEFKGKWICIDCYRDLDNCDYCGEKILEQDRVNTLNHSFCDDDCCNDFYEQSPHTFANYLEKNGITGYRLSQISGVPQPTISDLVTGTSYIYNCKWSTIIDLCKALEITPTQLHEYLQDKAPN